MIQQLGKAAEGIIATSLAPGAGDLPAVAAYVERWKQKEKGGNPTGYRTRNTCTTRRTWWPRS